MLCCQKLLCICENLCHVGVSLHTAYCTGHSGNWLENIAATRHTHTQTHSLPAPSLLQLFKSFCNMLQSFAAEKCAYLVFSTSYLLPVECTQISCHPASCMLEQGGMSSGGQREAGKGQRGWSAAKVYPFFFQCFDKHNWWCNRAQHWQRQNNINSSNSSNPGNPGSCSCTRHKIKPKAIYVVALALALVEEIYFCTYFMAHLCIESGKWWKKLSSSMLKLKHCSECIIT